MLYRNRDKRSTRQWYCENDQCHMNSGLSDTELHREIENSLQYIKDHIEQIEISSVSTNYRSKTSISMENKIVQTLENGHLNPDKVLSLIFRLAAEKYSKSLDFTFIEQTHMIREKLKLSLPHESNDALIISDLEGVIQKIMIGQNEFLLELMNGKNSISEFNAAETNSYYSGSRIEYRTEWVLQKTKGCCILSCQY